MEADPHHVEAGADCQGVLRNFISSDIGQLGNRQWAKLHAAARIALLDGVSVIDTSSAPREQSQVAVHAVLIERDQQVDPVTHVGDLFESGPNRQKSVAAANNRLVGVIGIQMQATAAEDFCENVARCGHPLSGPTSHTDSAGLLHPSLPYANPT